MPTQYDFKKEWEKTRKQLTQFSQEAIKVAQKGEKELVKFSRIGKLHVDSAALGLKKEQLFYLIGKEYVKANAPEKPTPQLDKLLSELKKADKEQEGLRVKIKNSNTPPKESKGSGDSKASE
jgi:predicted hydrocarbon binding protein